MGEKTDWSGMTNKNFSFVMYRTRNCLFPSSWGHGKKIVLQVGILPHGEESTRSQFHMQILYKPCTINSITYVCNYIIMCNVTIMLSFIVTIGIYYTKMQSSHLSIWIVNLFVYDVKI